MRVKSVLFDLEGTLTMNLPEYQSKQGNWVSVLRLAHPTLKRDLLRLRQLGYHLGVVGEDSELEVIQEIKGLGLLDVFDYIGQAKKGMIKEFANYNQTKLEDVIFVCKDAKRIKEASLEGALCIGVMAGVDGRVVLSHESDIVLKDVMVAIQLLMEDSSSMSKYKRMKEVVELPQVNL